MTKPRTTARRGGGRVDLGELIIGLALLALAGVIAFDAQRLEAGSLYGVGPSVAPMIVAGGLVLLGLATVFAALRARGGDAEEGIDRAAVIVIVAALAAMIALMSLGGGFVLACTVLFAGTARAFGRRAPAADVAIGLVLALVVYVVFTRALTLSLPDGPLEALVQRGLDRVAAALQAVPWPW